MTIGFSDSVSRALDAARRAAEEALRRAQEEAARQAAEEAAATAATPPTPDPGTTSGVPLPQDGVDATASYGPFTAYEGETTATATSRNGPTYSPGELAEANATGVVVEPPPPEVPPHDPIAPEDAPRLVSSFEAAAAAWETLPPDLQLVTVDPGAGSAQMVDAWIAGGEPGIGPGDPEAYAAYMNRNRDELGQLAAVLGEPTPVVPGAEIGTDLDAEVNRFTVPAIMALQEQYPDATFQVLVVESGTLPERMAGNWGIQDSAIVIEMRNGDDVEHFALNPYPLYDMSGTSPIYETIASDPQLLDTWYQSLQASAPGYDQGDALSTLEMITSPGHEPVAVQSVLAMPVEAQAQFLLGRAEVEPSAGERPFGILNRVDNVNALNVVAGADGTALAEGTRPASIDTLVNLAAVDGLDKMANFLSENYETVVAPLFDQFLMVRGDDPRPLAGTDLINEVGAAMHVQPNNFPQTEEDLALFEAGEWPFYTGDALATVTTVTDAIEGLGGPPAQVTALPITFHSEELGLVQLPLFRVQGSDGQELFVDNLGRRYDSFQEWRDENRLPPGQVTYPAGGHLTRGADGSAVTVTEVTHSVVDTLPEYVEQAGEAVLLVGGLVVGAAAVIGSGGALLPITAVALSLYGGGRSVQRLHDRAEHGQTLGLDNAEARGEWLNLGANALGVLSIFSGSIAKAIPQGSRWSSLATSVAQGFHVGANVADGLTMLDLGHTLVTNPNLTVEQRVMIVSQIGFWAGMSVYTAQRTHGLYSSDVMAPGPRGLDGLPASGRTEIPEGIGFTTDMESAIVTGMEQTGVVEIGFRDSADGASVWHGIAGETPGVPMFPSKPQGAMNLDPEIVMSMNAARAEQGLPPLHEAYPDLPIPQQVMGPDGELIWQRQLMFGEAKVVVLHPERNAAGQIVDGELAIVVSDADIAYAVATDGHVLTDDEINNVLRPAINGAYAEIIGADYDIVNHGAHFNGMQNPTYLENYNLDGQKYWDAAVHRFSASERGYIGDVTLGDAYHALVDPGYVPRHQR